MILEIALGVTVGNTISMGGIALTNLWLERKAMAKRKQYWADLSSKIDEVMDTEKIETTLRTSAKKRATAKKVS